MSGLVWYGAYGSNLHADRFEYYRRGGTPPGTRHVYPGFRDPAPPARTRALLAPGGIHFAGDSRVWGGGLAFYAPEFGAGAAMRGYLLTVGQFSDLVAQEMHRVPAADLDLREVLRDRRSTLGPGRYETLVLAGTVDGIPVLTCTGPWDPGEVEVRAPAARYLRMIATGLAETHGWDTHRIRAYLAPLPGIDGHWSPADLADLVDEALRPPGR